MVAAIIVNFNAGPLLAESVSAVLGTAARVIVVDNASSDGSVEELERRHGGHPSLDVIRRTCNGGFSVGCNEGIRRLRARADGPAFGAVLLLNPDAVCEHGAVHALRRELDACPGAGMAGGLLLSDDGAEQGGSRRAVPTPWRAFLRAFGLWRLGRWWPRAFPDFHLMYSPLPHEPVDVEAVSGACMMVSVRALEDVGLLDEDFFLHCEDLDWCMRFRQRGWRIRFVPGARVWHARGACSRRTPVAVELHKHRGMIRFYRKHFGEAYPPPLMWLVTAGVWLRFGLVAAWTSSASARPSPRVHAPA
jgi:hypothetical protein